MSNGGLGDVYYGRLTDGTRVAIKVFRHHLVHGEGDKKHLKVCNYAQPGGNFLRIVVYGEGVTYVVKMSAP